MVRVVNVTEKQASEMRCCGPSGCGEQPDGGRTGGNAPRICIGSACMAWCWDVGMYNGVDSYVSDPGPTGHCGHVNLGEPS